MSPECASYPWWGAGSITPVNVGCSDGWDQRPDKQQVVRCTFVHRQELCLWSGVHACASGRVGKTWEPNPSSASPEKGWAGAGG